MAMGFDYQQESVIQHRQGHALVLAGAGSGKTSTVTERAARLISEGMPTTSVVMVTFTNKAAREMRERIFVKLSNLGISSTKPPAVTTFHSFGQRIITRNPDSCDRTGIPSLMSEDDQEAMLLQSMKNHCNEFSQKIGMQFYEKIRNNGLSAGAKEDSYELSKMLYDLCMSIPVPVAWEPLLAGMVEYEECKRKTNTLDYHDLIILPLKAIKKDDVLRSRLQHHILDLTVDEAQDTNLGQYKLVKLLVPPDSKKQFVVMVGDEDQSIHTWRGANPENLKLFSDEYRPEHFHLEHNYRSLPQIVQVADKVIKNNTGRFEKQAIPTRKSINDGYPISCLKTKNSDEMAKSIALEIKKTMSDGASPSDIAILYRTNKMANLLEPALIMHDIPYKIYNGQDLLSRTESKIILSAIRFAVNPHDTMAFQRLTELMPGVGKKMIEKMIDDIRAGETIFNSAMRLPESSQCLVFPMLKSIIQLRNDGPTKIISWLDSQSEIKSWLLKKANSQLKISGTNKPKEFDVWKKFKRKELLSEEERSLLTGDPKTIGRCEKYQERLNETVKTFVERMQLVCKTVTGRCEQLPQNSTIADQWFEANNVIASPPDEEKKAPSVHLMTMHSSKGLEWKFVHLPGFSDTIIPLSRKDSDENPMHMQEERRLAYVGITRGRERVYIHHCDKINLMDGKGLRQINPSPFISEAGLVFDEKNDDYLKKNNPISDFSETEVLMR